MGQVRLSACLLVGTLFGAIVAEAERSPLWGGLDSGPHSAGFRVLYLEDATRPWFPPELPAETGERPARPVRVSIWYPAASVPSARPMTYREYVQLPPPPAAFRGLAAALEARNMASLRQVVRGEQALESLLATSTAAYGDAPPAPGRFPLVIYVSGLNESGQHANSVLGEYLASHGFVVAAIAQGSRTPSRLRLGINPIDLELQVRDVEYAGAALRALPFVGRRWAMAGHSMGGIVAMLAAARNRDVAAVVGLDASYGSSALLANLTSSPYFAPQHARAPLLDLRRSDPPADLAVLDSLRHADRYMGELPKIAHGDFTSFPMIASVVPVDIQGRTAEDARAGYERVVRTVAVFLKASLTGDERAALALDSEAGDATMRWRRAAALPAPPTEEQLVQMALERGVDAAIDSLSHRHDTGWVDERMILSMGYDFLEPGSDPRRAVRIFELLTRLRPQSADYLDSLAEAQIAAGEPARARATSQRVLEQLETDASLSEDQKAQLRDTAEQRLRDLPP